MRPQPYIGITGFMDQSEVRKVLAALPDATTHRLMVGVLMSSVTLLGGRSDQPNRYPAAAAVGNIFARHPRALNLLHYHTVSTGAALASEMRDARRFAGAACDGFQLNVKWPAPAALRSYRDESSSRDVIVLQCGPAALAEAPQAAQLAGRVAEYSGLIDYVLVDGSAGRGEPLSIGFAQEAFAELRKAVPEMGIGVAGGLTAASVERLAALIGADPDFSIDAEGRLRNADDHLDVEAAIQYLTAAAALFTNSVCSRQPESRRPDARQLNSRQRRPDRSIEGARPIVNHPLTTAAQIINQ